MLFLSYLVKTSPSKKRRNLSHGPLRKPPGTGPALMAQTSSNSQQSFLQHQVSSETEGDNGKKQNQDFSLRVEIEFSFWVTALLKHVLVRVWRASCTIQYQQFSLPFHPVMQSGRPDLLPKILPPGKDVGSAIETPVSSSSENPGFVATSQPPPQPQDVNTNNTQAKDQELSCLNE